MEVRSLNKACNIWCPHCTKKSCKIYDERPDDCREFNCVWMMTDLPDNLRPDRCGFVLSTTDADDVIQVNINPDTTRLDHRLRNAIQHFKQLGLRVIEVRP